jgi:hypothetical protein
VVGTGGLYFYANDTYYRPRPDLGGYEVVNDPVDSAPAGSNAAAATPYLAGPSTPMLATPASATYMTAPAAAGMTAAAAGMTAGAMAAPYAAPIAAAPVAAMPTAAAPGAMAAPVAAGQRPPKQQVSLTPNNGQPPEQQARDRYDCYRIALGQSGFDPLHPKSGVPTAQESAQESAYDQVRTACLQQRGYTVQ